MNLDYCAFDVASGASGVATGIEIIQNRHCNACGRHWWDGKEYNRKEWGQLNNHESKLGE